jgi:hypothetical protein
MGSGGRARNTAASPILRAPRTRVGRLPHHLHHLHHLHYPLRGVGDSRRSASLAVTRHDPPRRWCRWCRWCRSPTRRVSAAPLNQEVGARGGAGGAGRSLLPRRTRPTSGSASFGSPAPPTQPAVVSRPRHLDRSYVVAVAGTVAARRLQPRLHARAESPFGAVPEPARNARGRARKRE